jgi:hypothetical protein
VQVADTVLNKPFKNVVCQRFCDWSASLVAEQVKSGIAPKDYKLDLFVGRLRDEGIHSIYAGWERIKGMQRNVLDGYAKAGTLQIFEEGMRHRAAAACAQLGLQTELPRASAAEQAHANEVSAEDEEEADDDNDSDAELELSSGSSDVEWDSDFELPADKLFMRLRSIRKRTAIVSANPADEAAASGSLDEDGESAEDSDNAEVDKE